MIGLIPFWLIFGLIFALIGAVIGQKKGAPFAGFLYGFFFGPIGCLIVALLRGEAKVCPKCGERVHAGARICRYCHADLSGIDSQEGNLTVGSVFSRVFLYWILPVLALIGGVRYLDWKGDSERHAAWVRESAKERAAAMPSHIRDAPSLLTRATVLTVADSQRAAIQKHPDLAVSGSQFNKAFLAKLAAWRAARDPRLEKSDWPERLAEECGAGR